MSAHPAPKGASSSLKKDARPKVAYSFDHYADNKKVGEVDFLIDDYDSLGTRIIEVKSGKDFRNHRALDRFLESRENVEGIVLSNDGDLIRKGKVTYLPVYMSMFL